jgi:nitroreductase
MSKQFQEAMEFRHACKVFDTEKKITQKDIYNIVDMGRKSPSSFGMEGWKFLVITNPELKAKLRPLCWDQVQITSCSHLVVILSAIDALKPENGIVQKRFARRGLSQENITNYVNLYSSHLAKTLASDANIYEWSARQTYIAAANMMTYAATIGIDSCPIEGFEKENVEAVLGLDTKKFQVAMLLPFGYRINEQPSQMRLDFEEVVEFIE